MDKQNENGAGVQRTSVPHLTIALDPTTFRVTIGGDVPTWEVAEAMLYMALKETERKIHERRVQQSIAVAGPELLDALTGRKPQG